MTTSRILPSRSALLVAGTAGAAVGLWTAGWWLATVAAVERGWLFRGQALPLADLRSWIPPGSLADAVHMPLLSRPLLLVACLSLGGLVIGLLVVSLAALLQVDPQRVAARALLWALRSCLSRPIMVPALLAPIVAGTSFALSEDALSAVVLSLVALCTLLAPLALCRPEVVAHTPAGRWWRGSFPSWRLVLGVITISIVGWLISGSMEWLDAPIWQAAVTDILLTPLGLATTSVLVARSFTPLASLHFMRWPVLSAWVALQALLLVPLLVLAGPVSSVYVVLWKVVPVLATLCEGLDRTLPFAWTGGVNAARFFGRFWWGLLGVPAELLCSLAAGRLVWLATVEPTLGSGSAAKAP